MRGKPALYLGKTAAGYSLGAVLSAGPRTVGVPQVSIFETWDDCPVKRRPASPPHSATGTGEKCVRDKNTSRSLRSSGWKSGKAAEVSGEQILSLGASFLKPGCEFQDNWKSGADDSQRGVVFPRLQQGPRKPLWKRR